MEKKRVLVLVNLFAITVLAGCGHVDSQTATAETILVPQITPYRTATAVIADADVPRAPTPSPLPLPSPTPFMYTVVENDTLIAIAVRFGITLDELQVANPDVNPNILSLGTQLVIPVSFEEEDQNTDSGITLEEKEVACYPIRSGGLRCYWLVINSLEEAVENISGVIRLYDQGGQQVASKNAVTFLNLLEPGMQTPLFAFFEPPVGDWQLAQSQILTAVTVNQYEARYLQGTISQLVIGIAESGLQAEVRGKLSFESGRVPGYVWILATAYDADGDLVGVKRWEAPPEGLTNVLAFSFDVFSLGRPIAEVTIQYEARADNMSEPAP